jgi:hypothetical protein
MTSAVTRAVRGLASGGGRVLGGTAYLLGKRRRRAKALHPRGQLLSASLDRFGVVPTTGVAWVDEPGSDEVIVRMSRALGLPRGWPDILGLALRVPTSDDGHGDLLFATTGTGRLSRFVLRPTMAEPEETAYTTLLPYRTASGPVLFGAFPAAGSGEPRVELRCSGLTGTWRPFGMLRLGAEPTGDEVEPLVSFDPVLNTVPGLEPYEWHRRLRKYAYAAARRARGQSQGDAAAN